MTGALGYGGMIHDFKNCLLRKDQQRSTQAQRKIGALTEPLKQLALIDIFAEALPAVGLPRDAVSAHGKRLRAL